MAWLIVSQLNRNFDCLLIRIGKSEVQAKHCGIRLTSTIEGVRVRFPSPAPDFMVSPQAPSRQGHLIRNLNKDFSEFRLGIGLSSCGKPICLQIVGHSVREFPQANARNFSCVFITVTLYFYVANFYGLGYFVPLRAAAELLGALCPGLCFA